MKAVLNMIKMLRPFYGSITVMTKQYKKKYNSSKKVFSFLLVILVAYSK